MFRRSYLEAYLWPICLICALGLGLLTWNHHDVNETQAGFTTHAEAETWLKRETAAHKCLPNRMQSKITDLSADGLDPTGGHPFAVGLKCQGPGLYWKMALAIFGPWPLFLLCIRIGEGAKALV